MSVNPAQYRELIMARVAAVKSAQAAKDSRLAEIEADISALLAPLKAITKLLPGAVKDILAKYGF